MIDIAGFLKSLKWHIQMVKKLSWNEFPIICAFKARYNDKPERRKKSKYYISKDEYKWPYYPDFCLGGAYTTSISVVQKLWEVAQIEKPIKMDDVWVTGILRERIGMPRQYVRKLDKSVATHYYGYKKTRGKNKREAMRKEWEDQQRKLQNMTSCTCWV